MFYELRFADGEIIQALVGRYGTYLHEERRNYWFYSPSKSIEVAVEEYDEVFGLIGNTAFEIKEMEVIKKRD